MVVRREHQEGPVAGDAIKVLAGDRLVRGEDRVIGLLGDHQAVAGIGPEVCRYGICQGIEAMDTIKLKMMKFGGAGEKVHVAFDETRHHAGPAGIDAPCRRAYERRHVRPAAHTHDRVAGKGHGLGPRPDRIDRQDTGIFDDDVGIHGGSPNNRTPRRMRFPSANRGKATLALSPGPRSL